MKGKWHLGIIIFSISVIVGIIFGISPLTLLRNIILAVIDPVTLELFAIIILAIFLSNLLREKGNLKNIVISLETLVRNPRLSLIIPPAFMGLLPMPAGALFSAPMVEESTRNLKINAENKTFLNYWFRHIWDYCWPLYPGLILAATIINVPIRRIIITQFPLTLAAIFAGLFFGMRKISFPQNLANKKKPREVLQGLLSFITSMWPILAIIFLVLVFKIELILALLVITGIFLATTRMKGSKIFLAIKRSFSWEMLFLIASVMIFKRTLEISPLLSVIPTFFKDLGVSPLFFLFLIPFIIGLLTGLTAAFVGITFPLLLPLICQSEPNLIYVMLAHAGGFAGVLLSPIHLCLIVTIQYFKANFKKIYRILLLPVAFVVLVAMVIVLINQLWN
ncbi:DUF401 family protein [Candidatus Aerophobetes bacterium]|nr:DUF401 family protein [Candidatus Aerophobetes bacterium]